MKKIRMFSSAIVCAALLIGASSALVSCKPSSGGQTTINISGQAEISIQADSLDQDYQYTADQQCT
ncbi:hypothetical protein FACS1894166_04640 [Bacilli bacterium]|nr:hypothetical protein FACS1894166_04640 [Bacilli bacterium]